MSASTSTFSYYSNTSAATSLSNYWPAASWIGAYDRLPELIWSFEDRIELPAYEKSIHGRRRGRLKDPKTQKLRGYKPKISFNFYHKDRY